MKITMGIFAHVDAGKTTLSEQLLYHGEVIKNPGRVDHKNSYLDNHSIEKDRGITVFSDIGIFNYNDKEYYLIDTPGHIDFSPEMERAIAILDYAVLVISAVEGVQGHSETIWEILRKYNVPTFIFINKMDRVGSDLSRVLVEIKSKLSEQAIYLGNEFTLDNWGEELIEVVAESDEELLVKYLEEGYSKELWNQHFKDFINKGTVFPILSGVALLDKGIKKFLEIFTEITETKYNSKESFTGKVFKIKHDDKGARLTFVKILSGEVKPKDTIRYIANGEEFEEKINALRIYNGSKYEVIDLAKAGDIVALMGITNLSSGAGIGVSDTDNYKMVPTLKSRVIYDDKLNPRDILKCFKTLEAEEKSLGVVWNEALKEINVNIMGAVQLEVIKEVIKERFNLNIEFGEPNILYKETAMGERIGCGHFEPLGHYAEVILKLEEGERGAGIEFINKCHADHLTTGQQNLIKTHIFEREHNGILIGAPVTDLKITLLTGRAHNKHTSGGDFREATKRALRQGIDAMDNKVLEPYYRFKIDVQLDLIGKVISDIQRLEGTFGEPVNKGTRVTIEGRGPVVTFMNYGLEFQSFTKGKGALSLVFDGYDLCHNEDEVVERVGYDKNVDTEYTSTSIFCTKGQSYLVEAENAREAMHCLEK